MCDKIVFDFRMKIEIVMMISLVSIIVWLLLLIVMLQDECNTSDFISRAFSKIRGESYKESKT